MQDLQGEEDAINRYKTRIDQAEQLKEFALSQQLRIILAMEQEHAMDLKQALDKLRAAVDELAAVLEPFIAADLAGDNPSPDDSGGVTVNEVRTALSRVIKDYGSDGATEVLAGFGVRLVHDLQPGQYPGVIAACDSYLARSKARGGK